MPEAGTHLGALTTTFTPPPQCTIGIGECTTCDQIWLGQSCKQSVGAQDERTCWPPVDRTVPAPVHPYNGWGYYSPGISCPAGHTTACSATAGQPDANAFAFQFSLAADETAVGCCPTGFTCVLNREGRQTCKFNIDQSTTSLVVQTVTCDTKNGQSGGLNVLTMPQGKMTLQAPLIQMNFKATDLPSSAVSSSSTSSGPANSGLNNADTTSETTGLSSGAIAGIAIGIAILVLGILGAGIFIWRKKRADRNIESDDHNTSMNYGPPSIASPGPGHAELASSSSARYAPLGMAYHPSMEHRVASQAMTELPGADATAAVPAVGTNGSQEGKYYYAGHQTIVAEAPGLGHSAKELPA
ncbi:hypothetical protein V8F33_002187 [Rhypophila sp. PSN 637]